MKKRKIIKIIKNEYIFSIGSKIVTILISLINSIIVARYLGPELKGINAYITSIVSVGAIVVTFGMHQAYPYFRNKYGKEEVYRDFVSIIILVYGCYMIIASMLWVGLMIKMELKMAIFLIPLSGYSNVISYIILVEHPNLRNTWWTIISMLDVIYVLLLWLFIEQNIYSVFSIMLFSDLIKCVVFSFLLHIRPRFHKGLLKVYIELVKFGFFPMLALLLTTLNYRIDIFMLHKYDFITNAMLGVYSLGISLADKIILIPDTLKGVLVSKLAKGAENSEVAKVCRLGLWATISICFLVLILGQWGIHTFYGEEYKEAYVVLIITLVGVLSVGYFKLIAQYNIVNQKQILNVRLLCIAVIVDVILNLYFIPLWDIKGAAVATSIGNIVCGVVFILYFCKDTGIKVGEMIFIQKTDVELLKHLGEKRS